MILLSAIAALSPLDLAAGATLILSWLLVGWFIEHPPARHPSVSHLMKDYRRDWMGEFVTRQPRIFDATIVDSLRQGTSFLASACMIAIGGGVALLGNSERLRGIADDLSLLPEPVLVWQAKILLVILFVTNAMLKFVWSHRLFGYCAILMGSVPNDAGNPDASTRSAQAAEINILAAKSFNRGLRSVYFALGALGWLLGPLPLLLTTAATLYLTWRREFASHSRQILMRGRSDRA